MENVTSIVHITKDTANKFYAHVLAKRTYRVHGGKAPEAAEEQLAVVRDVVREGGDEDGLVAWEPDIYACPRDGTDLVVQGLAFSPGGPRRELDVSVDVKLAGAAAPAARRIRVFGDRRARWSSKGISFSDPSPFETMPISYRRAYGGHDHAADEAHPSDYAVWLARAAGTPVADFSPYTYPRNPAGTGYVIFPDKDAIDGLVLPNLERASELLTPERLAIGGAEAWPSAPRPAGFDWCDQDWFPRAAFLGIVPEFQGSAADIPEAREGIVPLDLLDPPEGDPFAQIGSKHTPRFFHGASPWLWLPSFTGRETIRIEHMHPTIPSLVIPMPGEAPQMILELARKPVTELVPAIRTVVVQPDRELFIVIWVGTMPIDRPPTEAEIRSARHAVRWKRWGSAR